MIRKSHIWRYIRHHWVLLIVFVSTSMVGALLDGFGMTLFFPVLQGMTGSEATAAVESVPFPFSTVYLSLMGLGLRERLAVVAGILFVITVVKGFVAYGTVISSSRLMIRVVRQYRDDCARQLMNVGMRYLNKQRLSDMQVLVDGYAESTAGAIVTLVGTVLPQAFTIIWLLALLVLLSWQLTLVAVILMALATAVLGGMSRSITNAARNVISLRYGFTRVLFDLLYGMKVIRLFNRENLMFERFSKADHDYNQARYKAAKLIGLVNPIFEIVGIGVLAAILLVGALLVSGTNPVWIGTLLTFVLILARLTLPVRQLNQSRASITEKLPTLYELDAFLDSDGKEYVTSGGRIFEGLAGSIEFRDVTFGYDPENPVLMNMSFTLPRGSSVGIVGPSGSGKSTISELLLRFYTPQSGSVLVDGVDLGDYEIGSWRRHVGVVSQDTFLFHDTIRNNIRFGSPDASDQEVEDAARSAHAHEFVSEMQQGYDTLVGDRGVLISGGQRQRIAIARAIIAQPEVLVFDEATSALDTESEQVVQAALESVAEGRTVLTIAHRLSTIADSDLILVVADGRIAEQGTHDELLAKNGLYTKLVSMQKLRPGSWKKIPSPGDDVV